MPPCCKTSSIIRDDDRAGNNTKSCQQCMNKLSPFYSPGPYDVVCGKGRAVKEHVGNQRYQSIIQSYMERYVKSTRKLQKIAIVSEIVALVRLSSPTGGFVKLNEEGEWYEVGDHFAREKVSQSLRDNLHALYRSSSRAKSIRRGALMKSKKTTNNNREITHPQEDAAADVASSEEE